MLADLFQSLPAISTNSPNRRTDLERQKPTCPSKKVIEPAPSGLPTSPAACLHLALDGRTSSVTAACARVAVGLVYDPRV